MIAAVHGYCMGLATQLAVCCDLTLVAEDAVIGWPSLPLGGGLLLAGELWLIGAKKAKELSYIAGWRLSGAEASASAGPTTRCPPTSWWRRARPWRAGGQDAARPAAAEEARDEPGARRAGLLGDGDLRGRVGRHRHDSQGMAGISAKVRELGLKGAIEWFEREG